MYTIPQLQEAFATYAQQHRFYKKPQELYDPINYILDLGGKHMRPVLALMACNLFTDKVDASLSVAYGVELFHNFSLMHDDIMDQAPLRRGKPSVHTKYDENTAILSGDAMLIYAYHYISQVPEQYLAKFIKIFNRTAIGVCEGQQMDINFETATKVEIDEYIKMIELKTAVLLQGAMEMAALLGGASEEAAWQIGEFGRCMGIAFQLQDDYLDTYGDPEKFGKRVGGDIIQNKKTFLVLQALKTAESTTQDALNNWMSTRVPAEEEDNKINAVRAIFDQLDIPVAIKKEMDLYKQKAIDALSEIEVDEERKRMLFAFLNKIMNREH